jgi:hypothetical protein
MTICLKCHRPLKNPPVNGMGPVCARTYQPVATVERDLFGYDIEAAALAAQVLLSGFIAGRVALAKYEIRREFYVLRQELTA